MLEFTVSFLGIFLAMEWIAWALHKFVMHGFLWNLHEDHHTPPKDRWWQKNDFFAIIFAFPSFFAILFGNINSNMILSGLGYGIMAYGVIYFAVHEVIIHKRLTWWNFNGWYWDAIRLAHQHHHSTNKKEGAINFGMLLPPIKYFTKSKAELRKSMMEQLH
ncbi:MAG: sterol desaturase family protein [Bdellovibrionales bacterium]